MRLSSIAGLLVLWAVPVAALAAPPPAVSGLEGALLPSGEVRIAWDPSPDGTVTAYRLYYSSESILESGGVYDDFERTEGAETEYIFEQAPAVDTLYVTVLAVNANGEESATFTEEVAVPLRTEGGASSGPYLPASSAASSAEPSSSAPAAGSTASLALPSSASAMSAASVSVPMHTDTVSDGKLHLLAAQATSPTQVRLTFSEPPMISSDDAPAAIRVEAPDGSTLSLVQLHIEGRDAVLDTAMQQRGVVYRIVLNEPLQGAGGKPLDATDRSAFFPGHEDGSIAVDTPQPAPSSGTPELRNLVLRAQPESAGGYRVIAQWELVAGSAGIASIEVRQSLDAGATFADPQTIGPGVAGVQIAGAQPGQLGVQVRAIGSDGTASAPVFATIELPAPNGTSAPPLGSVAPLPPVSGGKGTDLPQSGGGAAVAALVLTSAVIGWRRVRKFSAA